jgi:hypothetical protein
MLLRLLPAFYQQNQVSLALILPFAFTLSFIPVWIDRIAKIFHAKTKGAL